MTINSILTSEADKLDSVFSANNLVDSHDRMNEQVGIDLKMVTFSLAGKGYAIDIMYVKEIAKAGNFTYVPNAMPFVIGVYNLRGEIIPVLDMRIFFNLGVGFDNSRELENLLILNVAEQTFGIVVDKIDKVVGVQKRSVQPPHPMFVDIKVEYISGVVEHLGVLYILLAIEKIFSKVSIERTESSRSSEEREIEYDSENAVIAPAAIDNADTSVSEVQENPQISTDLKKEDKAYSLGNADVEYEEIAASLKKLKGFYVSDINKEWLLPRLEKWNEEHSNNPTINTKEEAEEFLKPFHSVFTNEWWSKGYADNIMRALPDTNDKNIVAWCLGCGGGIEAYCLACVLKERYPDSSLKVYAQDNDLLAISNASVVKVPSDNSSEWFSKYLTKTASGEFVFDKNIKESLFFEYHDCKHSSMTPKANIIFARDLLSLMDGESLKTIVMEFEEKLKDDGVIFIGDNELLPNSFGFVEKTIGTVTVYHKQ